MFSRLNKLGKCSMEQFILQRTMENRAQNRMQSFSEPFIGSCIFSITNIIQYLDIHRIIWHGTLLWWVFLEISVSQNTVWKGGRGCKQHLRSKETLLWYTWTRVYRPCHKNWETLVTQVTVASVAKWLPWPELTSLLFLYPLRRNSLQDKLLIHCLEHF